jgi:hypothetical protein
VKPHSKPYFNSLLLTRQAILGISLTVVLCSPILAIATEPSPKTHIYVIEYKKPVRGAETVNMLNAIFFVKVTPQQAESVLRTELDRIRKLFPPEGDVLANAWFSTTGNEVDEEQISLSDGSTSLIFTSKINKFTSKKNKILTWKEYEASKPGK